MKKTVSFLCVFILLICLSLPVQAAGQVDVVVTAGTDNVSVGDQVTFTVILDGNSDSAMEGFSFHVNLSDGLEYVNSSLQCGGLFQMSSYSTDSGLVSCVISKDSSGVSADDLTVLSLTCRVKSGASITEVCSVSDKLDNGAADSKWTLFDVNYEDLSYSLNRASASISVKDGVNPDTASSFSGKPSNSSNGNTGNTSVNPVTPGSATESADNSKPAESDTSSSQELPEDSQSNGADAVDNSLNENSKQEIASAEEITDSSIAEDDDSKDDDVDIQPVPAQSGIMTEEAVQQESGYRQFVLYIAAAVLLLLIAVGAAVAVIRKKRK